jgi:hypothetical protein
VSSLLKETSVEELTDTSAHSIMSSLETMNELIFPIYDDILHFAATLKDENLESFKTKRPAKGGDAFYQKKLN